MKTTAPKAISKDLPSLDQIPVPSGEAATTPAAPETPASVADATGSNAEIITQAVQRAASLAGRIAARNRASTDQSEKTTGNSKRSVTTVKFTGDGLNESERNALALLKAVAQLEKLTGCKLHLALSGK